jgi:hypothetical protein
LLPVGTHLHPHIGGDYRPRTVLASDDGIVSVLVGGDGSVAVDSHFQVAELFSIHLIVLGIGDQFECFRFRVTVVGVFDRTPVSKSHAEWHWCRQVLSLVDRWPWLWVR